MFYAIWRPRLTVPSEKTSIGWQRRLWLCLVRLENIPLALFTSVGRRYHISRFRSLPGSHSAMAKDKKEKRTRASLEAVSRGAKALWKETGRDSCSPLQ